MGGILSEEAPQAGSFPATGKKMILRVQCSHIAQVVDVSECCGSRITSEWTTADCMEAIEQATGVHRKCQTLMFGGREMTAKTTLQGMIGAQVTELPTRVTIFMIVNKDVFPQKLGPFAMVRVPYGSSDFQIPELSEDIRAGFYWEMKSSTLESYGLRSRTSRVSGQVSPLHAVIDDFNWRQAVCLPRGAQDFAWSYPVANWEKVETDAYIMDTWECSGAVEASGALKSFLTVGGFMFFDAEGRIVGASTPGRTQSSSSSGGLKFGQPQRWRLEWTHSLAEQGRFQRVTMREIVNTGARMFCWLRPNEVLEDGDGTPLPQQPQVPYGGLVYLFREDIMGNDPNGASLDRYFPVTVGGKSNVSNFGCQLPASALNDHLPFRAFSVVSGNVDASSQYIYPSQQTCLEEEDSDCEIAYETTTSYLPQSKTAPHFQVGEVVSLSFAPKLL